MGQLDTTLTKLTGDSGGTEARAGFPIILNRLGAWKKQFSVRATMAREVHLFQ